MVAYFIERLIHNGLVAIEFPLSFLFFILKYRVGPIKTKIKSCPPILILFQL